jgi:hypothetical protein
VAGSSLRKELVDLFGALEGWRLEPRTTPGATPLWCFLSAGKVEFSVAVDGAAIVLYVMDTDEEMTFPSRDAFVAWLQEHRPETMRQVPPRAKGKNRVRKFFEWE